MVASDLTRLARATGVHLCTDLRRIAVAAEILLSEDDRFVPSELATQPVHFEVGVLEVITQPAHLVLGRHVVASRAARGHDALLERLAPLLQERLAPGLLVGGRGELLNAPRRKVR